MDRRRGDFPRKNYKKRAFKKSYKVICARCGKEVMIEVLPPPDKALLCLDCYDRDK